MGSLSLRVSYSDTLLELERRDRHRKVQRKAFGFFEERGQESGRDWEDWFRAEDELGKG